MISIIIPTHGGAHLISNAVQSALNQDYPFKEIIVVDDNGKDTTNQLATHDILRNFIQEGKIIYIVHEKRMNGSASRNSGLKIAKGDYITFLDDDDVLLENKLSLQIEQLEETDDSVGASYSSKITKKKDAITSFYYAKEDGDLLFKHHMHKVSIGTGSLVIKKDVFKKITGYDESFYRHQDWEFVGKILNYYKIIPCVESYYVRNLTYRHNPEDIYISIRYMLHYLNNLHEISPRLSRFQINRIKSSNWASIGLKCLRQKKFLVFIKATKNINILLLIFYFFKNTFQYIFTKNTF